MTTKMPSVRNWRAKSRRTLCTAAEISCIWEVGPTLLTISFLCLGPPLDAGAGWKAMTKATSATTATPMTIPWSVPVTAISAADREDIELLIRAAWMVLLHIPGTGQPVADRHWSNAYRAGLPPT